MAALVTANILTEVETGKLAGFQHAQSVSEVVCHPGGIHVLSSSRDQCVRLWEIETGRLVRRFTTKGCGDMWGIRIIREGKEFLAASSSGLIYRYEMATGKVLKTYEHSKTAYRIALTPDGKNFVGTDGGNNAILWEIESGKSVRVFAGHTSDVYSAVVFNDGKTLITGSEDKRVKRWNLETGDCLKTSAAKPAFGEIYTIAKSPDEMGLAMVGDDSFLRLLDPVTLEEKWKVELGDEGEVVTWSPDGSMIACTSDDGNLYLVNSADGEVIRKIEVVGGSHTPITFTLDGKRLISGGDGYLHLHSVETGKQIFPEMGIPEKNFRYDHGIASPGGERVYLVDESMWFVHDRVDPTKNRRFEESANVTAFALSSDGGLVATGSTKGEVTIRETTRFEVTQKFKTAAQVLDIKFLPDGKTVVTAGKDRKAILWDLKSGKKIHEFEGHTREIEKMAVSNDGVQLITASWDGSVRVWNLVTKSESAHYPIVTKGRPGSVASLDEGRSFLVSVGANEIWGRVLPSLSMKGDIEIEAIKVLVRQLGDSDFKKRKAAMVELATYGKEIFPILEEMGVDDPEVRVRMESVADVFRGNLTQNKVEKVKEMEDEFSEVVSDSAGRLWAGILGTEGAAKIIIGEIDPETQKLQILETYDGVHGSIEVSFTSDDGHLLAINADGTYTLFEVNRE